jgi:hypothetical protein
MRTKELMALADDYRSWGTASQHSEARVALESAIEQLVAERDMTIAVNAGTGTLHGAIDHWQERAEKAEAELNRAEALLWELAPVLRVIAGAAFAESFAVKAAAALAKVDAFFDKESSDDNR